MIIALSAEARLDLELCRAMFEKDPDRLLELVSDWLEEHRLTPSEDFRVPDYLDEILTRSDTPFTPRALRVLSS